jgi:hypothetical protein
MFVRYDKIPSQLKLCSVHELRVRMVTYLSDEALFTRLDEGADDAMHLMAGHLAQFFSSIPNTVRPDKMEALLPLLFPRVLDREKPKGGARPVCNMQNVMTSSLDRLYACIITACLTEIDTHVRLVQTVLSKSLSIDVNMIWSIKSIDGFIQRLPTHAVTHMCPGTVYPATYAFSDVSGCFNNIPQGYPRPDDASLATLLDTVSYHNAARDVGPADGNDTYQRMVADTGVELPDGAVCAMASLLDGWPAELFTDRSKLDIRMFHYALVMKACACRAAMQDDPDDNIVLHITTDGTEMNVAGWITQEQFCSLSKAKKMDSFFLNSQHMLDALATLVMLQVLQAGNAVHASLLGVFQGSYSGA